MTNTRCIVPPAGHGGCLCVIVVIANLAGLASSGLEGLRLKLDGSLGRLCFRPGLEGRRLQLGLPGEQPCDTVPM